MADVSFAALQTSASREEPCQFKPEAHSFPEWLDQAGASAFLATLGVRRAPKTLQKARVTGVGSPPFRRICSRVVYEREVLKNWAEEQRSPLVHATSELPKRAA